MKVGLTAKDGISILALSGALDPKTLEVVKAGIRKLFRDGKNKFAINLTGTEGLTNEFIREFCYLNITARELAGEIVLVIGDATARSKVESFSNPKSIAVFPADDDAVKSFTAPPSSTGLSAPGGASTTVLTGDPALDDSMALLRGKDDEIKKLKAQLEEKEKGEIGKIKQENSRLKELTKTLEESILKHIEFRRLPVDDQAVKDRVRALEERIKKLAAQVDEKAAPAAKK